jgi:hypothetical protein
MIKEFCFVENQAKLSECREIYIGLLAFLILIQPRNMRHEIREREVL